MRLNLRHIIELRRTLPTVYFQIGGRVIFSFFVETQKIYLGPELEESKRKRSGATLIVLAEAAGQAVGPTCPGIARRFSTSQFYTS